MIAQLFSGVSPFKLSLILSILAFDVLLLPNCAEGIVCGKRMYKQRKTFLWPMVNKTTCGTAAPLKCICQTLPDCSLDKVFNSVSTTANFSAFQLAADIPPNKKNPTTRFGVRPPQECLWKITEGIGRRSLSLDRTKDFAKELVPLGRAAPAASKQSFAVCRLPAIGSPSYTELCKVGEILLKGSKSPSVYWCGRDSRVTFNNYVGLVSNLPVEASVTITASVRADVSMNCTYNKGCRLKIDTHADKISAADCTPVNLPVGPTVFSFTMTDTNGTCYLKDDKDAEVSIERLCLEIGDIIAEDQTSTVQLQISLCTEYFATTRTSATFSFTSNTDRTMTLFVFAEGLDVSKWSFYCPA